MKAIDFYKFIHENNIEFHWGENPETKDRDVIFFPSYSQIDDFSNLLTTFDFDDDGLKCVMKDGYFCFWAYDLLANHDIELIDIFGNDTDS